MGCTELPRAVRQQFIRARQSLDQSRENGQGEQIADRKSGFGVGLKAARFLYEKKSSAGESPPMRREAHDEASHTTVPFINAGLRRRRRLRMCLRESSFVPGGRTARAGGHADTARYIPYPRVG
jgi:hypothetical protein